jgi:imidazolonepropionase-like amidohydrolase
MRTTSGPAWNALLRGALLAFALLAFRAPAAWAQEGGESGGEAAKEEEAEEKEKDEGDWFAVVGGDVYTGTGAVLREATVLARGGVIRAIGHEVDVPAGAKTLDARGLRVYPGLVALNTSGLMGNTSSDFADSVDPFNSRMVLALASGITTTSQANVALKLKRREIKGVVLREKYLTTLSYSGSNPRGKVELVEKFVAAAEYLRKYRDWEEKKKEQKDLKEPSKKGVDSTVLSILKGDALARFNANERGELLDVARLAQRFGFRPVIDGCVEGWTVAEELGRAGAIAVVTPRTRRDKSEELVRPGGSSIENAAILRRHGVQVAIVATEGFIDLGGIAGRDIMTLPLEAGFAVRGGLPEQAALEAITIVPARTLGVDHRVGTLEVGKDCDLIVTDGDLFHYQTFAQYTVVEGKVVYEKAKELYFAHIRPRSESVLAPAERVDAGEAAAPAPEEKPEEGEAPPKEGGDDEQEKNGGGDGR